MNAQGIEELGKGLVPLEFQTENLVLLIGTNPLPNLVAAKLLLKEDGTLYLVHSADTGAIALQLEKALMDRYGVHQCQKVEVDQASARDVRTKIESLMKTSRGSVGLHYTGGTKTMAVHTYRAIESGTPRTAPRPVFSYLDANSFELRVDPDWHEKVLFPTVTCPYCGRRVPTWKGSYIFLVIGFIGQAAFSGRFLVQWLAMEKARASVIPVAFWWLSIVGSVLLLAYAISIRAWPIILGQTPSVFVYSRNLYFIRKNNEGLPDAETGVGGEGKA